MIRKKFMQLFRRDQLIADGIIEIMKWPSKGAISFVDPMTNISIGMLGTEIRKQLKDCIVREDENPLEGIDNIISVAAWPQIWRFVTREKKLASIIVEYGINSRFEKVFSKVENRIREIFAGSIERHITDMEYADYTWGYNKHCCCLMVLLDKIAYLRPGVADMVYSDIELEGTFIRKPKTKDNILPTIAVIFSKEKKMRDLCIRYIAFDLSKRSKATTFIRPVDLDEYII